MESTLLEETSTQEEILGSRNHSYIQSTLIAALFNLDQFAVYAELSLDIDGKEYKPDIALYPPEQGVNSFTTDILRMNEMPLCAIEILSPRQFMESILEKFRIYFAQGIKSCWLVIPNLHTIVVYSDMETIQSFSSGNMEDNKLNIRLPLAQIFRKMD